MSLDSDCAEYYGVKEKFLASFHLLDSVFFIVHACPSYKSTDGVERRSGGNISIGPKSMSRLVNVCVLLMCVFYHFHCVL